MKKFKFATSFIINQLGLLVEDKCLNDTCAEHLVMDASKRLEELEQELAALKASLPKIKAEAVLDYAKNMESIERSAKLKMEQGLRMMASFAKKTAEEHANKLKAGK